MTKLHRALLTVTALGAATSCATTETDRDLFTQADTNRDGHLSLEEVNKMGLPRMFNRFDVNGDGFVTLDEARKVEPDFDDNLFTERDLNKDGRVSYQEYEKIALSKGGLRKAFSGVDANQDGIIDKAEAEAHVASLEKQNAASN